ncbi:hypothetical protein [Anaerococcus tetradius]|nr:hypothetical protein [Anaerococcus tetradius]
MPEKDQKQNKQILALSIKLAKRKRSRRYTNNINRQPTFFV